MSLLSCVFCCWPLGLVAVIFSCIANSHAKRGNYTEAKKKINVARGFVCGAVFFGILMMIAFAVYVFAVSNGSQYDYCEGHHCGDSEDYNYGEDIYDIVDVETNLEDMPNPEIDPVTGKPFPPGVNGEGKQY